MRPAPSVRLSSCLVALVCLGAGLSGCRPGSALHNRYNNFRAFYNTYYNAERSLEEGEGALQQSAVTVDRNQLVDVFPVTGGAQQTGPFQDAIDKSAELLRDRPTSKWADDALLVIGKAYFYQRNFVGAEQKFRETMAAAAVTEDRRLGDEARFWLGRTYAAADRFEEGVTVLEEGLAEEGGDRRWTARMELALGELYARAERWDEAGEALRAGAPDEDDADVAARAYVLLGQVEEHAERWDEAAAAYEEALRRRPAYELAYAADVGRALVIGIGAGQHQDGLGIIRAMRSDDKHYDRRGELALVEARLRAAAGEDGRARELFRDVLYDEELNARAVRGEAHYRLGEFYRDALGDFVLASAHFDTAATVLRAPAAEVRPARGAILDVADEAQTYSALAGTARRVAEVDSLLALGGLSEDAFQARIAEIEAERRRVYIEEQRRLQEARTAQAFSGSGGAVGIEGRQGSAQAAAQAAAATGTDGGFLSHRLPASIQAGQIAFEQQWGDRPLVPNWRRRAAIQAGDVASDRGVVGTQVQGGLGLGEGPPPLDLSQIPRTPEKRAELVTQLAALRYELANAFFLSLGRADTAAAIYRMILDETPDVAVAVRARYALAEIERAAGREDAARSLYESVAAVDSAALGRASRVRLGLEDEGVAVPPADAGASAAYEAARQVWLGGDPLAAATVLVALGDGDPQAPLAPRVYFAAAAAFAEWAGADTLALVRPLPDSLVSPVLLAEADSIATVEARAAQAETEARAAEPTDAPPQPTPDPGPPSDEEPRVRDRDGERALGGEVDGEEPVVSGLEGVPVGGNPRRPQRQGDDRPARQALPTPDDALAAPTSAPEAVTATPRLPLAPVDSASFTLRHHLRAVASLYPESPYGGRALALADALPAPLPPPPDSSDATPRDSLALPDSTRIGPDLPAADSTLLTPDVAALDSTQAAPARTDSAVTVTPTPPRPGDLPDKTQVTRAPTEEPDLPGLRGDAPLDPALGGVTWNVRTLSIPDEGLPLVGVLRDAGFRAALLRDPEANVYVLAIGQFDDEGAAEEARDRLPAWARLRGQVVDLGAYELVADPNAVDEPAADEATDDGPGDLRLDAP